MAGPSLTAAGLVIETADEVQADIAAQLQSALGGTLQATDGSTVIGQIVGALAVVIQRNQQALQGVYMARYPSGASGTALDGLAQWLGLTRNLATYSTITATAAKAGAGSVTIPQGATLQNTATGDIWAVVSAVTVPGSGTAPLALRAVQVGPVQAPPAIAWQWITPFAGYTAVTVTNGSAGTVGTAQETDAELRLRISQSAHLPGRGTIDSLRAALLDLDGVTECAVYENPTGTTGITSPVVITGLPGHSFVAVLRGTNAQTADVIFSQKPVGIDTYGASSATVTDSQGVPHLIRWQQAAPLQCYATLSLNGTVTGTANAIKAAMSAYVAGLTVGQKAIGVQLIAAALVAAGPLAGVGAFNLGTSPGPVTQDVTPAWNQYCGLAAVDIVLTLP